MNILMNREAAITLIRQRIAEGNELANAIIDNRDADGWGLKLEYSLKRILGDTSESVVNFKHRKGIVSMHDAARTRQMAQQAVFRTIEKLNSLIEIISEQEVLEANIPPQAQVSTQQTNKVFLVHGRADAPKAEVARFLEKLGLEVTILHERPNRGRSLIAKFEQEAADVSFAVVLMTADDEGGLKGDEARPRARQNVVFELGFFIGRLGADRVCALVQEGVERPSDFEGVAYVSLDALGAWKAEVTKELAAAKLPIDIARAFAS